MKQFITFIILMVIGFGCSTEANIASRNLSMAADMFEIKRRVVFYNGITGDYVLSVEGLCSIEVDTIDGQLELTCKVGPREFKKHFLGLSDNVTYFAEQIEGSETDIYQYRVIFKPKAILPNIEVY